MSVLLGDFGHGGPIKQSSLERAFETRRIARAAVAEHRRLKEVYQLDRSRRQSAPANCNRVEYVPGHRVIEQNKRVLEGEERLADGKLTVLSAIRRLLS